MNKARKIALPTLLFNTAFAVYYIVTGIVTHSWWLFTLGIYYTILSCVRFVVLATKRQSRFIPKFAGTMLMALSLPLVGTVILSIEQNRGAAMHKVVMIAMAAYAFAKITLAVIHLVKSGKSTSAKYVTLRSIAFADACVSIFALQRSMLVSFGNMHKGEMDIFNALLGSAVCVAVFWLGIHLFRNKKARSDSLERG